jgi:hypothetical protein
MEGVMSKLISVIVFLILAVLSLSAADAVPGGMKIIQGYNFRRGRAVDASAWTIEKQNGARIEFECGPNEGSWASPKNVKTYVWYRERIVNGYLVRLALTKKDLRTVWDDEDEHHPGNVLLVSFLLEGSKSDRTADFKARIANSSDMADVLLMVLTFDPAKSGY